MIVFYQHKSKIKELPIRMKACCDTPCIVPKSKCCQKYKKKGVNCKRCPILVEELSFQKVS